MNNDCLLEIAQFASPKQVMQLTPEYAERFFPSSVSIHGHQQLEEFYRWAQHFDTSNLTEVLIVIREKKIATGSEPVVVHPIGLVPPSVKKLTLCVYTDELIQISDTVEELIVETSGFSSLFLPDSIRRLELKKAFFTTVYKWPANLEYLEIEGWCSGNGRWPVPIDEIPDSVKYMVLGAQLDIEIINWPASLESLVILGDPEEHGWSASDLDVPESVIVSIEPDSVWVPV